MNATSSQDLYETFERRLDTIVGTTDFMNFARALRKAHEAFVLTNPDSDKFAESMLELYGIRLLYTDSGNIDRQIFITDQQKYLIFKLKWE